ncbi:MAG: hypothetical protein JWN22_3047 [Nocardioides sp.]|nr:hypothetical protein [Nocardioides sp.]
MPGWFVPALAVFVFVWSFGVGIAFESRVLDWYLARAGGRPLRAVAWVVGTHLVALLGWLVVFGLGTAIARRSGSHEPAAVVAVPAMLVYGPWLVQFLPAGRSGYSLARDDLGNRGASRATARALTWSGAPFGFAGMAVMFTAFMLVFVT